jgi:hypothetical protein
MATKAAAPAPLLNESDLNDLGFALSVLFEGLAGEGFDVSGFGIIGSPQLIY